MRPVDRMQLAAHWPLWATSVRDPSHRFENNENFRMHVGLLSPDPFEVELIHRLFPGAQKVLLSKDDWDLNGESFRNFDLVVASNVFMYSPDPMLWFDNVLHCCNRFWMQDHVLSWRGGYGEDATELGSDGDRTRYKFTPECPGQPDAFDLARLSGELRAFHAYDYTAEMGNGSGKPAKSFLASFRGRLT